MLQNFSSFKVLFLTFIIAFQLISWSFGEIFSEEGEIQTQFLVRKNSTTNYLKFQKSATNYDSSSITRKTTQQRKLRIGVLGAPFDKGQPKHGVVDGPKFCRNTGFIEILRSKAHLDIVDYGNVKFNFDDIETRSESCTDCHTRNRRAAKAKNVNEVSFGAKLISDKVKSILKDDRICLTLGGDHSMSIGTIDAVSSIYNDVAILYVDAHGDINTPETSPGGNIHGMPLSFVIKELEPEAKKTPAFSWVKPRVSASNLAYISLRDVDPGEIIIIRDLNITVFNMKDVRELGIKKVMQMVMAKFSYPNGRKYPLHLSYDIDSMDESLISITGTIARGGLTLNEGLTIMQEIYKTGNLVSMDLAEVNPRLGNAEERAKGSKVIKKLLLSIFGYNL